MKRIILSLFSILIVTCLFSQVPQSFKYQSVVRASNGTIIAEQNVAFRISILQGSSSGSAVYTETFSVPTNKFGLATFNIGQGTTSDDFTAINWSTGLYWVKVELDPLNGISFEEVGTSQLLSVPYALNAKTAGNAYWIKSGNDLSYTTGKVGIGTSTPLYGLDVSGSNQYGISWIKESTLPHTGVHEAILYIANNSNNASSQANISFAAGNPGHGRAIISATHDVSAGTYSGNLTLKVRNGSTSYLNAINIRSSGNVGINELNPDAKLHINGNAHVTGDLVVNGTISGGINISSSINDLSGNGITASVIVDVNSVGFGAALFIASDGNYEEADADVVATMPCVALALETGTGTKKVLLQGYIRLDTWTLTPGNLIFISPTTGAITQTRPSTTGQQVQIIGYAVKSNILFFNPNLMLIELK